MDITHCLLINWADFKIGIHSWVTLNPQPAQLHLLPTVSVKKGVIDSIPPECNGCTWALSSVLDTRGCTRGGMDRCSLSPRHTRPGHGRQENGVCDRERGREGQFDSSGLFKRH